MIGDLDPAMKNSLQSAIFLCLLFSGFAAEPKPLLEQAVIAERKGDVSHAVELATQAIAASPASAEPYFYRARFYSTAHDHKSAIADLDKVIEIAPQFASAYHQRGGEHFKLGHIEASLKDFDKTIELMPAQAPHDWQRGISLYYAGKYDLGRKQFEDHQKVNPQDVENAVWHFLCVAKERDLDTARKTLIPIRRDSRIPLMEVYALFGGAGSEDAVLKAAQAGKPTNLELKERLFYAHLYLGLYDDITGKAAEAADHLRKAATDYYQDNYMGDVARVHLALLEQKKDQAGAAPDQLLQAGEGMIEIIPPLGIEMAGFHRAPGNERKITAIRQPPQVRALWLKFGDSQAAILSLDVCGFDAAFAQRIQKRVAELGIPAENVRICATHTHAMPTLRYFRQWGAIPKDFKAQVENACVDAARKAKSDLARADLYYGRDSVHGGNFNRTSKTWSTDQSFAKDSNDSERWLDTKLQALYFLRLEPKQSLVWYQFSAHPVCYTDDQAGPDWPGIVARYLQDRDGLRPSFLQGHCGDVNPGPGEPWLGIPEKVAESVYAALHHAIGHSELVQVTELKNRRAKLELPFNIPLLNEELEQYRANPATCNTGEWVDAGFAQDWFESASKWDLKKTSYSTTISALSFGDLALVFHPAELYSVYGLQIQRDSPFAKTLVIGYCDDFTGYIPDPVAYEKREYAAVVVPKILDLPPFAPTAGRTLAASAIDLLKSLK